MLTRSYQKERALQRLGASAQQLGVGCWSGECSAQGQDAELGQHPQSWGPLTEQELPPAKPLLKTGRLSRPTAIGRSSARGQRPGHSYKEAMWGAPFSSNGAPQEGPRCSWEPEGRQPPQDMTQMLSPHPRG